MQGTPHDSRPSRWWTATAIGVIGLAFMVGIAATLHQRRVSTPIGEGEVFVENAQQAATILAAAPDITSGVRHVRNDLRLELVEVVEESGFILASTSKGRVGSAVDSEFLTFGIGEGRFAAVPIQLSQPITIDEVQEWGPGDILYTAASPLADGGALVMAYDITDLFEQRARAAGLGPATTQLLAIAMALLMVAGVLLAGRSRAVRRFAVVQAETSVLLEHNRDLQIARETAEEALALAEEKNRIRSEFVLMINHELRTPLTAVVTGAELLHSAMLDEEEQTQVLDDLVADGKRLEGLIGQMLAVARIENRGLNFDLRPAGLIEACRRAVTENPRLDHCDGPHPDVAVSTDLGSLVQLLGSLADNAITHGASTVELECRGDLGFRPDITSGPLPDEAVYMVVRDDGPGIDREFLPRLFQKFEKDSFSSGTGLGMYMASLVAEALGGAIAVKTSQQGTAMAVAIPTVESEGDRS